MLFLLAYCLIVASFVSWSSRTKSSLSKVSIALVLSRDCILYFTVFITIKQIVVKAYLKYVASHRIEVFYSVFYHLYIYKITKFELVAKKLDKMKEITSCVN